MHEIISVMPPSLSAQQQYNMTRKGKHYTARRRWVSHSYKSRIQLNVTSSAAVYIHIRTYKRLLSCRPT